MITRGQEVDLHQLKNEMIAALRALQDLIQNGDHPPSRNENNEDIRLRNLKELIVILEQLKLCVDVNHKLTIISKDSGDFIIDLITGTVNFIPIICIKCNEQKNCKYSIRKICIVEHSEGWANFSFSRIDMLILSKVIAILHDQLPDHVIKQVKSLSDCFNKKAKLEKLENNVIREFRAEDSQFPNAPPILGPISPPEFNKPHLRFTPPPQELKHTLDNPRLLKLRSSILRELKRLHQLIVLSKKLDTSASVL